ncbi:MAG: glycosyltransferase [Flavobacteriales bacterium]|nr:glycosyltransferase [Flavobacteriales bacterium]
MRIAVNTRLLIKNKLDGIGRFSFEILKRITTNHPEIEFHFIFDRPFSSEFIFSKNIIPHILAPQTRHPILWWIWFQIRLPKLIKKINPDLFFSPDGFMPTQISTPTVITIHDINFEHRPKDLAWSHSFFYRKYFKQYAKLSNHIITVSHFSKKDIIEKYAIDQSKISVMYNGISNIFTEIPEKEKTKIKNQYSAGCDFFLFIGSLHKRKNIRNLLLAFDIYKSCNPKSKNKLIIIGNKKWWDKKTENDFKNMKFRSEVIFLGSIEDNIMKSILAAAKALIFTSIFEGFGLPIIEAMKSGVPVITSNTSAMPEVAGNAALIVNPHDINDINTAIQKIDTNNELRSELIQKGKERIKIFDWKKTSDGIGEILKKQIHTNGKI